MFECNWSYDLIFLISCIQNHLVISKKINHKHKGSLCLFLKFIVFNIALRWYIDISLNSNMFVWFNFWNILNICILNICIAIIKFGGHRASKCGTIYTTRVAILDLITPIPILWIYIYILNVKTILHANKINNKGEIRH